jgi:protein-S-isoprenylcysteine O-methyltransferase Ste14
MNNQAGLNGKSRTAQSHTAAALADSPGSAEETRPADAAVSSRQRRPPPSIGRGRSQQTESESELAMTEVHTLTQRTPHSQGGLFGRLLALLYGVMSYLIFFITFLYAVGFVENLVVPQTIDTGPAAPWPPALVINLLLLSVFALQHSIMARPAFKQWWTQFVPASVERTTYVLAASLALALVLWQWRPMPVVIWHIADPGIALPVIILSLIGWFIVLTSTFLINHFELFGLHQVANNLAGRPMPAARFRTPLFYQFVRHPIYLGFIIAFWAAPTMTVGHLLFAAVTTAYILVGIQLEERDLIDLFGDQYRSYKQRVSMLVPWRK